DGQFEAAGHTDERGVGSGLDGGALSSVDEAVHDLRVPGGGDDGDAQFGGVDGEFGCSGVGHVLSFFRVLVSRVSGLWRAADRRACGGARGSRRTPEVQLATAPAESAPEAGVPVTAGSVSEWCMRSRFVVR